MKMTWGMKLFSVAMVMALMFAALHLNNPGFKLTAETKTPARRSFAESSFIGPYWTTTTREPSGSNLNRKMFTLSENGGILFRPPYNSITTPNPWSSPTPYKASTDTSRPYRTSRPYSTSTPYSTSSPYTTTSRPYSTSTPYSTTSSPYSTTKRMTTRAPTTTPYHTTRPYRTTRPTHAWTTASPFRGVSVCLRYLASYQRDSPLFILSPSTNPLKLSVGGTGAYVLQYQRYYSYSVYLTPYIRFWTNISPEIWNRVCLTFDNMKKVAQIFSGSNMSIRKLIPEAVPRLRPHLVLHQLLSQRKDTIGGRLRETGKPANQQARARERATP
ncbi:uncharacterized protein LOC117821395 isoform X2 [Xyrichtys novacula]|uniref:Uncharacterized protein LOC117821395 isoform X2 n=1 Tax=Xyrichtys novacula TaxID=13765 RepID=A0AAV1ETW6_XYRNO|nr:uncharacterized protein LOC117821395 isoform X2 [Xyrichtys novacula]